MAVFADLPRELRQSILRYAFEEAAQKDSEFNGHLEHDYVRCTIPSSLPLTMNIRTYTVACTPAPRETTQLKFIRGTRTEIENSKAYKGSQKEYFAPHIEMQATKLVASFSGHREDVLYVLDKTLNYMQELVEEENKAIALELKGYPSELEADLARRGRFAGWSRLVAGYRGTQMDRNVPWSAPDEA